MAEIREKMLAADVIVWASPIYFYTMTAQMEAGDIRKTDAYEKPPSSPKWESVAV